MSYKQNKRNNYLRVWRTCNACYTQICYLRSCGR